jgi:hypothetical protein
MKQVLIWDRKFLIQKLKEICTEINHTIPLLLTVQYLIGSPFVAHMAALTL